MSAATSPVPLVSPDQALAVAQADATTAYRDLADYAIRLALEADGWHIDYEIREPTRKGGGPHYIIDATTGEIVLKRYEQ